MIAKGAHPDLGPLSMLLRACCCPSASSGSARLAHVLLLATTSGFLQAGKQTLLGGYSCSLLEQVTIRDYMLQQGLKPVLSLPHASDSGFHNCQP